MMDEEDDGVTCVGLDFETLTIRLVRGGELFVDLMQPGDHAWVTLDAEQTQLIRDYLDPKKETP